MKNAGFGLMVLVFAVVFGFMFLGCDTGGGGGGGPGVYPGDIGDTGGNGTAPSFDAIIITDSSAKINSWTTTNTMSVNGTFYWGIKNLNDPEKDIKRYGFDTYIGGVKGISVEYDIPSSLPSYPYTGPLGQSDLSSLNTETKNQAVGSTFYYDVYFVDSKGNKSVSKKTNTITFTN